MTDEIKTAHLAEIYDHCEAEGCWKPAVVELLDRYDVPQGRFCKLCGTRALARLKKEEKKPVQP
jgi:hypothetical protein